MNLCRRPTKVPARNAKGNNAELKVIETLGTLLYDSDGNHLFMGENPFSGETRYHTRKVVRPNPLSVDQFLTRVDEVAGSQVGTFLVHPVNNRVLLYRNKIERQFGDNAMEDEIKAASPGHRI